MWSGFAYDSPRFAPSLVARSRVRIAESAVARNERLGALQSVNAVDHALGNEVRRRSHVPHGTQETRGEGLGMNLAAEFHDRVTLVEIPHAGHALLPEQPEQVEKAVLTYLRSRGGTR